MTRCAVLVTLVMAVSMAPALAQQPQNQDLKELWRRLVVSDEDVRRQQRQQPAADLDALLRVLRSDDAQPLGDRSGVIGQTFTGVVTVESTHPNAGLSFLIKAQDGRAGAWSGPIQPAVFIEVMPGEPHNVWGASPVPILLQFSASVATGDDPRTKRFLPVLPDRQAEPLVLPPPPDEAKTERLLGLTGTRIRIRGTVAWIAIESSRAGVPATCRVTFSDAVVEEVLPER